MAYMNDSRWKDYPNFTAAEFKCPCGCDGGNPSMDENLVALLQAIRTEFGKPIKITSGHRCQTYNDTLKNSVKNSDHIKCKAADIYIAGYTDTEKGRGIIMGFARSCKGFKFAYCDGMSMTKTTLKSYSAPLMGKAVHISVE